MQKSVKRGDFIVLLLLSASIERVSVSPMRDLFYDYQNNVNFCAKKPGKNHTLKALMRLDQGKL